MSKLSPRSVSESTVQLVAAASPRPVYLGYDTFSCPTNTFLQSWLHGTAPQNPPFYFIGFYLAPTNSQNRLESSYMSRRADIAGIGYGFGIFYLGYRNEELVGLTTAECTQRGQNDDLDAVGLASTGAGFTHGIIYFDRENNKRTPENGPTANELTYIQAWINFVTNNGMFTAGLYCNRPWAAALNSGLTGVSPWWWIAGTQGGPGCSTNIGTLTPYDSGVAFADSWQYGQNCTNQKWNNQPPSGTVTVDLNMSFDQNPSHTA